MSGQIMMYSMLWTSLILFAAYTYFSLRSNREGDEARGEKIDNLEHRDKEHDKSIKSNTTYIQKVEKSIDGDAIEEIRKWRDEIEEIAKRQRKREKKAIEYMKRFEERFKQIEDSEIIKSLDEIKELAKTTKELVRHISNEVEENEDEITDLREEVNDLEDEIENNEGRIKDNEWGDYVQDNRIDRIEKELDKKQ